MKVLMVEPGKAPYEAELDGSLKSMQEAVGGSIEGYYPYAEPVAIVCNDEGKINGLPLNRAIYNQDGEMIEIMAGTFFHSRSRRGKFCRPSRSLYGAV